MRGKIPWFTPPPKSEGEDETTVIEGREGRLGEMPKKRKRENEDASSISTPLALPTDMKNVDEGGDDEAEDDDDEFAGFSEDDEPDGVAEDDAEKETASGNEDDMIPLEEMSDSDDGSSNGEEHG